jgi:methylphosphotriester-DNA--protein-cysteine methyltransferase
VTPEDLTHLRRARDLMDREYASPLNVPAMARAALMSPSHFARQFRAAYGETPYGYLMTRRIERGLHDGRLHVARLVQRPVHRAGGRTAERVPRPHTRRGGRRARLPRAADDEAEQVSRSAGRVAFLGFAAWI